MEKSPQSAFYRFEDFLIRKGYFPSDVAIRTKFTYFYIGKSRVSVRIQISRMRSPRH